MKTVIIGVGIPASGKTTLLRPLAQELSLVYLNADDIRRELTNDERNHTREPEVWKLLRDRLEEAIRHGGAIVDATHTRRRDRHELIEVSRDNGAEYIKVVWLQTDVETVLARNSTRPAPVPEEAIRRMANRLDLNPPTRSEGIDEIEIIK
jgi:predicted kinase